MSTENYDLPACCFATSEDSLAKNLYAVYNRAGVRQGLNYQGLPCPTWENLPPDIRTKWEAVADFVSSRGQQG